MRQVIFRLPFLDIPIFGYGLMLFVAFLACNWLAVRRARRDGIAPEPVQDLAFLVFAGGLVGSRLVYMVQFHVAWSDFYKIWDGGLVFYGGLLGGAAAFALAYRLILRPRGLATLRVADVIAPCLALGLSLGRVGCLLNGCCYGAVACPDCPAVTFPLSGMPRGDLVYHGIQTAAGFTLAEDVPGNDAAVVYGVEPGSAAERAGLRPGDAIVAADGREMKDEWALGEYLTTMWPRGKNDLTLSVVRGGETVEVGPFAPRTVGLHPTQLYETVSAALLMLLLLAYDPFRRQHGELMALFLMLYPLHRFLNEMLRSDNKPVWQGLTLSQNGSLIVFVVGLVLMLWLRRLPRSVGPSLAR